MARQWQQHKAGSLGERRSFSSPRPGTGKAAGMLAIRLDDWTPDKRSATVYAIRVNCLGVDDMSLMVGEPHRDCPWCDMAPSKAFRHSEDLCAYMRYWDHEVLNG